MDSCAITGVAVVDVEQGTVHPNQMVVIEGDQIQQIAPQAGSVAPDGAQVVEGRGLFLMPGLVDAHVHYFDPETFGRMMIAHGVTLVRDTGHPTEQALQVRAALDQGAILGPQMITAGSILDGDPPFIPQISISCPTTEAGREAVRQQATAGVDQIKVYSRLEKDVYLAIVDEAHQQGIAPVGHVPESVYVEDAAAAGQRNCEHLFGFEKVVGKLVGEPVSFEVGGMGAAAHHWLRLPEVDRKELQVILRRIGDHGMAVCPTVIVFKAGTHMADIQTGQYPMLEYVSPMIRGIWASMWDPPQQETDMAGKVWPHMQSFVKELYEAGVTLMIGTDLLFPGVIPGYAVHEEMALWQEAGVPPVNVLRSATIVPAQFCGLGDRLGAVAEGKTASLVLVRGNPLDDIRHAREIESVFLRGRYLNRGDLARLLEETRALAQPRGR